MIGLLDGDIVVFRCGFAAERTAWHLCWEPLKEVDPSGAFSMHTGEFRHSEVFEYKKDAEAKLMIVTGKPTTEYHNVSIK